MAVQEIFSSVSNLSRENSLAPTAGCATQPPRQTRTSALFPARAIDSHWGKYSPKPLISTPRHSIKIRIKKKGKIERKENRKWRRKKSPAWCCFTSMLLGYDDKVAAGGDGNLAWRRCVWQLCQRSGGCFQQLQTPRRKISLNAFQESRYERRGGEEEKRRSGGGSQQEETAKLLSSNDGKMRMNFLTDSVEYLGIIWRNISLCFHGPADLDYFLWTFSSRETCTHWNENR